ncbi:unnamed protein product [Prorocentrum cordatum]|uniref:ATP-grasp domain-containing protein n=1 Tax=Prorocentrum cordatum TaxID=2364126 RepID=A0ABN9SPX1_9DINO|nr:unnamed protein product [Polarella glacialis]
MQDTTACPSGCSIKSDASTHFEAQTLSVSSLPALHDAQDGLYGPLLRESGSAVLFGWWPRSRSWVRTELAERTTRCLPAVRPRVDFVALPLLPEVEELWGCWSEAHGLVSDQAVWFHPRLEGPSASDDPALAVCREVLAQLAGSRNVVFYPMYWLPEIAQEATTFNMPMIGDPEDHRLMPLNAAKAWLHPHVGARDSSCLRTVLSALGGRVRGPRGFVAYNVDELREALVQLRRECPAGTKFVLKPAAGSGGCGVVLDATEAHLDAFVFGSSGGSAILEEMIIGLDIPQSPTLYMIGDTPCGPLADQVLADDCATNLGNRFPSMLQGEDLFSACVTASQEINKTWGMTSNWGLDFVLDKGGDAVIVDINMGRPNGNFAVRLWASISEKPLTVFTGSWTVPLHGPSIESIFESLRAANILWNGDEGVIVYQYVPGCPSSYAIASAHGPDGVSQLQVRLSKIMLDVNGIVLS